MGKRAHRGIRVVVAWLGLTWVAGVSADTLRCNGGLVRDGDLATQVLRICGEPWQRERVSTTELRAIVGSAREVRGAVQRWTYNFGPTKFIRHVYFVDGRLRSIKTGPRGTLQAAAPKRR